MATAQVNGFRMHYQESGGGPEAIIFVHGYTGCWLWWDETMRRLPPRYHAFAPDLRGAGDSDQPEDGYTAEQYAQDVFAFSQAVGLQRFVYVGHSMGGAIGYQLALTHQARLKALVLVNPAPADGLVARPGMTEEETALLRETFLATFKTDREAAVRFYREAALHRPIAQPLLEAISDKGMGISEGHLRQSLQWLLDLRLGQRLQEITVPTLMVGSDRDALVPLETMLEAWRRLPNCGLHIFQRVGHSPQLEVPEEFTQVLVDFIDNLE